MQPLDTQGVTYLDPQSLPAGWQQQVARGDPRVVSLAQYRMAAYGVLSPDTPPLAEWLAPSNCSTQRRFSAYQRLAPVELGLAPCRSRPFWCELGREHRGSAPPQLHGSVPCRLLRECDFLQGLSFYAAPSNATPRDDVHARALQRTLGCLRNRRVVLLGDSVTRELAMELILLLSSSVPRRANGPLMAPCASGGHEATA